jgi:hypothetical protein
VNGKNPPPGMQRQQFRIAAIAHSAQETKASFKMSLKFILNWLGSWLTKLD